VENILTEIGLEKKILKIAYEQQIFLKMLVTFNLKLKLQKTT